MKLKLDDAGHVVVQDGKPVYVYEDGKESPFDAAATLQTISRINSEAKSHRERAEVAEKSLKAFSGITDPAAAIRALETVSNLDLKKLVDAGEVEKVKSEISKAFEAKISELSTEKDKLEKQLVGEIIGGSFSRSKFIAEKLSIPVDMVQSKFGSNFKLENGQVVSYDHSGNKIYSRERPGESANFDEAMAILVDSYSHRDSILKGSGSSGGGARNSQTQPGGVKTVTREVFGSMGAEERSSFLKEKGVVTD